MSSEEELIRIVVTPEDVQAAASEAIKMINETIESGPLEGLQVKRLALVTAMGVFVALIVDEQYDIVGSALRMVGQILEANSDQHAEEFIKARQKAN